MSRLDLRGRAIAITGASSGIGAATAVECARAGMRVALCARRTERLEAVAERIRAIGGTAVVLACDVSRESDCFAFIERASAEIGPLHGVFANAGYGVETPSLDMTDGEWEAMLRTNFWGTLWIVRAAVAQMRQKPEPPTGESRGHVLVCSSCLSKIGAPYHAAYSASKACQDHLARALRHELADERIDVSSVHPIGTSTEFFEELERNSPRSQGLSSSNTSLQPPERVARAVVACLGKPRGEVWTSTPTRIALGLATAFPSIADWGVARYMRSHMQK
ncbi:MAG: SDR family oxidoreductase [Phycisphaeraceae bacterium]|nr:SDR family oxidoreductase [Phycisphaeraceae bacterium]MBX3366529.1 SDR family oxidoreductase [Phycisphaeraceae bacterium]